MPPEFTDAEREADRQQSVSYFLPSVEAVAAGRPSPPTDVALED